MTGRRDLFETIAIVIALDMLYNNFDITIASIVKTENKSINEIFIIIQSKEAKLKSKLVIGNISNIIPSFCTLPNKIKATYDNLYYNYYYKGHFGQNCSLSDHKRKTNIFANSNLSGRNIITHWLGFCHNKDIR